MGKTRAWHSSAVMLYAYCHVKAHSVQGSGQACSLCGAQAWGGAETKGDWEPCMVIDDS
jgi:hypothetical protein